VPRDGDVGRAGGLFDGNLGWRCLVELRDQRDFLFRRVRSREDFSFSILHCLKLHVRRSHLTSNFHLKQTVTRGRETWKS
jgi:hypothetical protein